MTTVALGNRTDALDAVFAAWNRSDAPGVAVGVTKHGEVIYRRGFGLASLESAVANTPRTRMRIGSTTKHFTCLAVLLLAEDGKLDIDDSVRRYIPELPAFEREPTLRHLMTHSSGYRCAIDLLYFANADSIVPRDIAFEPMFRQRATNFPAGEQMAYCNGGFHLLGLVIERASGGSYEDFLEQRIFRPLGMADTTVLRSDFTLLRGMATLHVAHRKSFRRALTQTEMIGEGSIVSTVDDMLRWLDHMRNPQLVGNAATWRTMLSGACYADGNPSHCCMGLIREFYDGIEIIHHPGRIVGGACQILMVPEHGLGVVVIANRADINALKLSKHVVRAMLGNLSQSKPPARPERAMRLNGFYYSARSRQLYGFGGRCGTPTLSLNNVPGAVLTSDGYGGLAAVSVDMGELTIRRDGPPASGTPDRLTITYCGKSEIYERLPDERPSTTVAAAGLLGQYYSHDIDAVAVISLRDGALVLEVQGRYGWPVYILTPLTADIIAFAAPEAGGFRGVMSVERTACEAGTLWINTNRTRNLQFVRMGAPAN